MDLFSTVLEVDYQDDHLHGEPRADLADLVNKPKINHLRAQKPAKMTEIKKSKVQVLIKVGYNI